MHKAAAGGSLDVIKFLLPLFGAKVHEKTNSSYSMLHWAAQKGHCQVTRYLMEELDMDPQDRDKVRGVLVYVCAWFSLCSEACYDKTGVTWTRLCTVLCYAFIVLSHSLFTASCLVMDRQCIVFTSFSQPVIAGCCRIHVAGIFESIIV